MQEQAPLTGTVYVVEDDASMRQALSLTLRARGHVVRDFADPAGLLRLPALEVPALVLLDVRLHRDSGVEVHARLQDKGHRTPVVLMSGQSRPEEIVQGFRQGALNFLLKPFGSDQLLAAVDEALRQDQARFERDSRIERLRQRLSQLTPREREVCRLMAKGYPNREIAAEHGTAAGTVKLQRASVLDKLQVRGMSELARLFEGVDPDPLLGEEA